VSLIALGTGPASDDDGDEAVAEIVAPTQLVIRRSTGRPRRGPLLVG